MTSTLAHYELHGSIGKGAMGEVFLARDTTLDRRIALKILPAEFAGNPDRLARFQREARAAAAINHPGIVTLHTIEQATNADGQVVHFLTMELVEGLPLRESIPERGMRLSELLDFGTQLADAVAAAHTQGFLHRDLKPDNIMLTDDRRVKILDFGLALQIETGPGDSSSETEAPTATEQLTAEGRVLGTPAYMSPEQADGSEVDHRSDIFSLGVLLYEMASGERPFQGRSASSVISAILRDEPKPLTDAKPGLPEELGKITRRCLQKQLDRRYQSALDIRNDLAELTQEISSGSTSSQRLSAAPATPSRLPWVLGGAAIAAIAAVVLLSGRSEEPIESPAASSSTLATEPVRITDFPGQELFPNLSSDGKTLIYAHERDHSWGIYRQRIGGRKPIELTADHDGNDTMPALSPDDELIAFRSERDGGGIFVMGATGESVRRVSDVGYNPSWAPDGRRLVYSTTPVTLQTDIPLETEFWIVDIEYGQAERIDGAVGGLPRWSPNGHRIAYFSIRENRHRDIATIAVEGGEPVWVTETEGDSSSATWSLDGKSLFYRPGLFSSAGVSRVPIDEETGHVSGPPREVTQTTSGSHGHLSIAGDVLAFAAQTFREAIEVAPVGTEATKEATAPRVLTFDTQDLFVYDCSSESDRLLFMKGGIPERRLLTMRTDGSDIRELAVGTISVPRWSPDESRIALSWNRGEKYEIFTMRDDGSDLRQLTAHPKGTSAFSVWSPDGQRLAYWQESTNSIHLIDANVDTPVTSLDGAIPGTDRLIPYDWSDDGRTILASRGLGGVGAVLVIDLETETIEELAETGLSPRWLADGRIAYVEEDQILVLDEASGEPRPLLAGPRIKVNRFIAPAPNSDHVFYVHTDTQADIWTARLPPAANATTE